MPVPNQKVIKINKSKVVKNFMQISKDNMYAAMKVLSHGELKIYLYLASNADGYTFELSPAAIENATGVSRSSYHRAITSLTEKGYITLVTGNFYEFTESPKI